MDWKFIHEHNELIQSLILDQMRLIKRGICFPVYTKIRNLPIWIKIEEFGGYQAPDKLGVISNDTEIIILESDDKDSPENLHKFQFPRLTIVPHPGFEFICNSSLKIPDICSFQNHSFKIQKNDLIPNDVLLMPDVLLSKIFKIVPKDRIVLSSNFSKASKFNGSIIYSKNGSKIYFDPVKHSDETIISTPEGIAIKTNSSEPNQFHVIPSVAPNGFNELADFLQKTSHRLVLFHGSAGSGKTKLIHDAINQLNYSLNFLLKLKYIDLMNSDLIIDLKMDVSTVFFLDHFDEYLLRESESDEKITIKYSNVSKKILHFLQMQKDSRFILISRSSKVFSRFSTIISLPFDSVFKFESSETWNLNLKTEPLDCIYGLDDAKKFLEINILNPLQFSNIYKANQMNLYSR